MWCKAFDKAQWEHWVGGGNFTGAAVVRAVKGDLRSGYIGDDAIQGVVFASCTRPSDPVRQQWVAIARQVVMNVNGLNNEQLGQKLALFATHRDQRKAIARETCASLESDAGGALAAQVTNTAWRAILGCKASKHAQVHWRTMANMAALPSQVIRAAWVTRCLGVNRNSFGSSDNYLMNPNWVASYAMCGQDARQLDAKALNSELDATETSLYARVAAHQAHAYAQMYSQWLTRSYQALAAKDRDLQQLLFVAPEEGFKSWKAAYQANQAAMDLARSYETAFQEHRGSKRDLAAAFAGCSDKLRKALAKHVAATKPRTVAGVRAAATDAVGQLLGHALVVCDAVEGRPFLAAIDYHIFYLEALPVGGPRDAALRAARYRLAEIEADREDFRLRTNAFSPHQRDDGHWVTDAIERLDIRYAFPKDGGWSDRVGGEAADGVIAQVKKHDQGTLLRFKTVKWAEPTYSCVDTNRIDRITSQGTVIYQQKCKRTGTTTRSSTLAPVIVPAAFPGKLEPGMMVRLYAELGGGDQPRRGIPLEVYRDRNKTKLRTVLGMPVK